MKLRWFFLIIILIFSNLLAAEVVNLDSPELLAAAKKLPAEGVLRQKRDGYVYLEVPDDYIDKLAPLLKGSSSMPNDNAIGAHVTVADSREIKKYALIPFPHQGSRYHFIAVQIRQVITKHCVEGKDGTRIWYSLKIEAPELDELRKQVGLPQKTIPFHISIGYQQQIYPEQPCFSHKKHDRGIGFKF